MNDVVKSLSTRLPPAADKPADRPSREEAEAAVRTLIRWAGDDPQREGLRETPKRVAKAFREFYSGYKEDPGEVLDKIFAEVEGYDDLVLVRDIPFHSHCEHHMVPFFGMAHIAYFPSKGVVGLSKLARLVDLFAKRPSVQERLTSQVADALVERLDPRGVIVVVEAEHMCMTVRGVRKPGARTVTSAVRGVLKSSAVTRSEAMSLILGR